MQIHHNIKHFNFRNPVVSVGIFDGVHQGHISVLDKIKEEAALTNGESVVFTLWPHPRMVLSTNPEKTDLLNTIDEKLFLLEREEIDHAIIFPFSPEVSKLSARAFIQKVLIGEIGLKKLIIGHDHKFGSDKINDPVTLEKYGREYGFSVHKTAPHVVDGVVVSSTLIRELIKAGNFEKANDFLGYHYSLSASVTTGNKEGRKIGFPTANLVVADNYKLMPANGVYAVSVSTGDFSCAGMLNIGYRPTYSDSQILPTMEVHLIGYDGSLYGKQIRVSFVKKIRDEIKFGNTDQLKNQLLKDKEFVLSLSIDSPDFYSF